MNNLLRKFENLYEGINLKDEELEVKLTFGEIQSILLGLRAIEGYSLLVKKTYKEHKDKIAQEMTL